MPTKSISDYPWRCYLAPVLLITVVVGQRYLMYFHKLDPWKGGGFGMFSSVSARNLRQMTVTLVTSGGIEHRFPPSTIASRIPLNGDMRRQRSRLLTMPRVAVLQRLADRLAAAQWVEVLPVPSEPADTKQQPDDSIVTATASTSADVVQTQQPAYYRMKQDVDDDAKTEPFDLQQVRVELWQYELNRETDELQLTMLTNAVASHE